MNTVAQAIIAEAQAKIAYIHTLNRPAHVVASAVARWQAEIASAATVAAKQLGAAATVALAVYRHEPTPGHWLALIAAVEAHTEARLQRQHGDLFIGPKGSVFLVQRTPAGRLRARRWNKGRNAFQSTSYSIQAHGQAFAAYGERG